MTQFTEISGAGFVDAGTLPAFVPNVLGVRRQDLLNSTLLGQLSADKLFSRTARPEDWYQKYFETLGKTGWQLDTFSFKSLRPLSATFSFEEIGLQLLGQKLSSAELALARKTMRSLRGLPDTDPRVIVFNDKALSIDSVNAQVSVRTSVAMVNVGFFFTTSQEVNSLLHEEFETTRLKKDIKTIVQVAVLNEAVYSQVRESVIEKLGARREELILELDISLNSSVKSA